MSRQPSGKVYFIQAKPAGPIKIGFSYQPEQRLRALRLSSPVPLRLVGWVRGTLRQEQVLHSRLKAHRLHGEWFESSPLILRFMRRCLGRRSMTLRLPVTPLCLSTEIPIPPKWTPPRPLVESRTGRPGRRPEGPWWNRGKGWWCSKIEGRLYYLARGAEKRTEAEEKFLSLMARASAATQPGHVQEDLVATLAWV